MVSTPIRGGFFVKNDSPARRSFAKEGDFQSLKTKIPTFDIGQKILTMRKVIFGGLLLLLSCQSESVDYKSLTWEGEQGGVQAVVEIPAGTNLKLEYQPESGSIEPDQADGADRYIDFLPYPGNYGFIPGTIMDPSRGGDGDALDVLILGQSVTSGTVVEFAPIGLLKLLDAGEVDTKVIGVPISDDLRVMDISSFQDFLIRYDSARRIIEEWFLHYKGYGVMEVEGWDDEAAARAYIREWAQ